MHGNLICIRNKTSKTQKRTRKKAQEQDKTKRQEQDKRPEQEQRQDKTNKEVQVLYHASFVSTLEGGGGRDIPPVGIPLIIPTLACSIATVTKVFPFP